MKLKEAMLELDKNSKFKFVLKWSIGITLMIECIRLWGSLIIDYVL